MDLISFINTQEPVKSWTTAKKQAFLDDLVSTHGYQETIDEKPNPETKKDFANRMIKEQIKRWVNGWRKTKAEKKLIVDEIDFNN
jgi:ribosome modulation factor